MKLDHSVAALQAPRADAGQAPHAPAGSALRTLAAIGAIFALYHETFWSMVQVWSRSQTFAHGFVIVPISAWLIWRQRSRLGAIGQRPSAWGLALLAALGALWSLAHIADVPVLTQYAVTAMIPAVVIAMLGWDLARALAFPLAYLMLAVPFGEIFIPPLIDFTADFTVGALQLTGVPVFRENNYFSIPSGNWSVVEACSGLRYAIASLALGTLYAYLNYRSLGRRLAFIGIALIVPLFANGVRAYLIVMIGHWSDMKLAVGIDHLIYGWAFFGLVCLLLFWIASHWREPVAVALPVPARRRQAAARLGHAGAAFAALAIAASWPLLAAILSGTRPAPAPGPGSLSIGTPAPPWVAIPAGVHGWSAPHAGAPLQFMQSYRSAHAEAYLQLAWYASQAKDAELLTALPNPFGNQWRIISQANRSVAAAGRHLSVRQAVLQSPRRRLLVWRWYRQSGTDTDSALLVKLLLAKSRLLHSTEDGAEIIVAAPFDEHQDAAEQALLDFLAAILPAIDKGLSDAARH